MGKGISRRIVGVKGRMFSYVLTITVITVISAIFVKRSTASGSEKVSQFGEYSGYSEEVYDDYLRRSDYITLKDGSKLAYDLLLPTRKGTPAKEPLPVLFAYTAYLRATRLITEGGDVNTDFLELIGENNWITKTFIWIASLFSNNGFMVDQTERDPWLKDMMRHGYAIVVVERTGTGASSGVMTPLFKAIADETDEIVNWIAAQPWSNGNIGMFGKSYLAITQYAAASTGNPHLKAIFPCSASFDMYDAVVYPGGIFNTSFTSLLARSTGVLETMVVPVDSDTDGSQLSEILEKRRERTLGNLVDFAFKPATFRDSDSPHPEGTNLWEDMGLYTFIDQINDSGVAVYNSSGWPDIFARDVLLWHGNLTVPHRLHVRPLDHSALGSGASDLDYGAEAHRWFDYWLKGIDNGIMQEQPIHYYVVGASEENAWRTSDQWPLANQRLTRFYFSEGKTGSISSVNDGFLRKQQPEDEDEYDAYTVDYSTTTGARSRWDAIMMNSDYPNMRSNDQKALTYTTAPLETDVEVTGHPVVHLWIRIDVPDLDFFVYIEEVDKRGNSTYITEGSLRASHRALSDAPFNNLGLPYQRSYETDLSPIIAGQPVELVFDLLPTSYLFKKGNRIRIAVTCADKDNYEAILYDVAPEVQLLRSEAYASFVDLPIIPGS